VYLVNTGWIGGAYGTGKRIGIPETRRIIRATRSGELLNVPSEHLPGLNLTIPKKIRGLDSLITNPRDAWRSETDYEAGCRSLIAKFHENFTQFDVSEATISAGPR
jgi:phosphoenolpyruvate carboxykinase (ATP)